MKKLVTLSLALAFGSVSYSGAAVAGEDCEQQAKVEAKVLQVAEVESLVKSKKAHVFDANGKATREKEGVVPGAKLLSSGQYDTAKELPAAKDAKLVFYCGNDKCRAADGAAARAKGAGYKDVNVMRAGIAGWKKAGKATETVKASS